LQTRLIVKDQVHIPCQHLTTLKRIIKVHQSQRRCKKRFSQHQWTWEVNLLKWNQKRWLTPWPQKVNNGRSINTIFNKKWKTKESKSKKMMKNNRRIDKNVLKQNWKWKLFIRSKLKKWLSIKNLWPRMSYLKVIDCIRD
jgi:hypothetical protein